MIQVGQIQQKLQFISDYLEKEMIQELISQGHKATGELVQSVKNEVRQTSKGWRIIGRSLFYGVYVDRGRPSGIKKVPISALINWIVSKRFESDKKKIRSMAFAVQYNIWKNGIKDPQKLGWITNTLKANEGRIRHDVEAAFSDILKLSIANMVRMTNTQLK